MKRKAILAITIILAIALATSGAIALFSHTIQVGRFKLTAGAVEISIKDGMTINLDDIKPCYTGYLIFTIVNVGTNPVDIYKHIYNIVCCENGVTPAERQWYKQHNNGEPKNDIHNWMLYDLWVEVYTSDGLLWYQGIYDETVTVAWVESRWIYLGMLPVGCTMKVIQSYHLRIDTGNWAQTDQMCFSVEVKAEQLNGIRRLENKDASNWLIQQHDPVFGTLTYNVKGNDFEYTFEGQTTATIETDYKLIYYLEPWGQTPQYIEIDKGTTDGTGYITLSGTIDIGSLPQPPDTNFDYGAKIWLVLEADCEDGKMTAWNPDAYLFETGLIIHAD